jgi:hypothetical protein
MLDSSARRPSSRAPRSLLRAVAAVLASGLLLSACSEDEESAPPEAAPTPIASLNTVAMQVPRIEFCALVPKDAVSDALGGEAESDAAYGNGDEEELPGVGEDVVHEIGCSWTGKDGSAARAWMFARPISADFARTVVASAKRTKACRLVPGPAYGKPAMTQLCDLPDGTRRVRHAGLFGQTWLTCEVSSGELEAAELRARTDRWCVDVANSLNTAR